MDEKDQRYYSKPVTVQYYECDFRNNMRLSFLLKHAQQLAMEQCDQLGIGHRFMASLNKAFLLAKLRGTIHRLPQAGEKLLARTIPFMPVKAQYQRLMEFYDEQGALLVKLDTRWLLADTQTRRIVRKMPLELEGQFNQPEGLEDFRLPRMEGLKEREQITVRYSQMDVNRHMNNTVYADLLTDCAEDILMEGEENRISGFGIVYHKEARLGETLQLSRRVMEKAVVVQGVKEEGACFEGWLEWK